MSESAAVATLDPPRRPAVFTTALTLVGAGLVIGTLDLVVNTVGIYTTLFSWRDHITPFGSLVATLAVPAVVHLGTAIATGWLLLGTARRRRVSRIGLATLMFCFVPGAAVNYGITELFAVAYLLTDTFGDNGVPGWAADLLRVSLIADAALLLLALAAGILLVLPASSQYADQP